jgi:hypothetical protein
MFTLDPDRLYQLGGGKLVKIKAMLIAVLALAVAAVAGCGGASD